jgi:hypothetical protein
LWRRLSGKYKLLSRVWIGPWLCKIISFVGFFFFWGFNVFLLRMEKVSFGVFISRLTIFFFFFVNVMVLFGELLDT